MKTIVWKELREHARWVPLGAMPIIMILLLKWWSFDLVFDPAYYASSLSLAWLVGVVAGGVAVCLGVLQSWPDQRPAARALLLHRGITANTAFCGKLLAGLILYAGAVFVPLLVMAAFIAASGIQHRAASPGDLLPAALMGVVAFCGWPAAVLIAQRDARFVGSRAMPALTAGIAVFACAALMNEVLWLTIVITATVLTCFLVAARSVFVNSSQVAIGAGRVAIAIIVTLSLLVVDMFLLSIVQLYQNRATALSRQAANARHLVELGPDGKPWLTRAIYSNRTYKYEADQAAPLLSGRSVRDQLQPVPRDWKPLKRWSPYMNPNYRPAVGRRFIYLCAIPVPAGTAYIHRTWVLDRNRDAVLVYQIREDRRYHLETTLLPPAPAASFGQLSNLSTDTNGTNTTIVTSTGVFRLPGHGTTVELIYAWPKGAKLLGSEFANTRDPQADAFSLLARLDDRILLMECKLEDGATIGVKSLGKFTGLDEVFVTEVRLPDELKQSRGDSFARDPAADGAFVALTHNYVYDRDQITWIRFDHQGQVFERAEYHNSADDNTLELGKASVAFIPPATFLLGAVIMAIEAEQGVGFQYMWDQANESPKNTATFIGFCLLQPLIGIPLAWWAARRRRLDKRQTRWWLLWAFFYGPCGGLAILAVYPRIANELCPACRKSTRVDLAHCEYCGHSLDDTPMTGVEIFDNDRSIVRQTPATSSM
jgi:hypothetical protein